jgi:DNA polymerase-3 subunit gamma/tau
MSTESYLVSARKYRPQTFDMVVGQSHVTQTLKNAILNQQLAHAYLFCGPRGVGKTTCARIFAKTINCLNLLPNADPCNTCESCVAFNNNSSLNIYELDAASNNSVDDIRALVDQVRFAPHLGKYKVYIIDEVHMLSQAAFNAFLKTLEEPPPYAKFILATTEKHKILPTILSRCQVFTFNRIGLNDIVGYLEYLCKNENVEYDKDSLYLIAQKADGGLRDACSIFDQQVAFGRGKLRKEEVSENLNMLDEILMFEFSSLIAQGKIAEILEKLDKIVKKGFDLQLFLVGLAGHFRNMFMALNSQTLPLIECSEELKNKYSEATKIYPYPLLTKILQLLSRADINYRNARNPRLFTETILIQLCSLTFQTDEKKNSVFETEQAQIKKDIKVDPPVKEKLKFSNEPISKSQFENYLKNSKPIHELIQIVKESPAPYTISDYIQKPSDLNTETIQEPHENTSEKEILNVLDEYSRMLFERKKFLSIAFKNAEKSFNNGFVQLIFQNEADKLAFEDERLVLHEFITKSKGININGISVDVKKSIESPENLNTPLKRFEEIIKEKPWIAELKNDLKLNLEF